MQSEKIISIKKLGKMKTMDIEVKNNTHCFYGDGIATSNSHSYSYAINGYWSAYMKAHFPIQFFTSYLRYAKEKQDPLMEIKELINEAKLMDIEVVTPDLRSMKKHFFTDGQKVQFGLADIKGIGEAQVDKLKQAILTAEEIYHKKIEDLSWYEFLVLVSPNVQSTTIERLIDVGALNYMERSFAPHPDK